MLCRKTCEGAKSENPGMHCCAGKPYNPETDTCCRDKGVFTDKMNEKVSKCCGLQAYNPLNEMCCDFTVQTKPFPMAECCGKAAFSSKTQLCCGENRKILGRISPDHRCCYENQYNIKTECCCSGQIQPKVSGCCGNNSTTRTDSAETSEAGHEYGKSAKPPTTVYDPKTHICCDGCLTKLEPWMDQCCGDSPHGLAQRGVLCCGNRLYHNREDGEECSESGVPYKPFAETVCAHKRHNSPGGHCCGEELYQPNKTVCCKGQSVSQNRYDRGKYIRCCGIHAYNISDPLKKCCKGTLHNLTTGEENDLECCGSELLNATNQEVCCTSEEQSLFYPAKDGFRCCGHHYYDSALWSCCAGKLSP
uniref:Galaxin-like repeats domain-containing protein n=1 Tax=Poecilia formosa TaxID=48698 RepID=A0A096MA17_POEFO